MDIRKLAGVAGLAAGAALAFAPLASADDLTTTLDGEISSLNSIFEGEAALAGDSGDITTNAGGFDIVPLADAPLNGTGTLDAELYGVDPLAAGPASDPGSYNVFNGALTEFFDAYNVESFALQNDGLLDQNGLDFIGSSSTIDHALGLLNATEAAEYFYDYGIGDLSGYFDTNLSFLDIGSGI